MKYLLYAGRYLVGWSALEMTDSSMGCVTGVFHPNENYEKIESVIKEYSDCCTSSATVDEEKHQRVWSEVKSLELVVKPERGEPFEPISVYLIDCTDELGDESGRELSVVGLPCEVFEKYFQLSFDRY